MLSEEQNRRQILQLALAGAGLAVIGQSKAAQAPSGKRIRIALPSPGTAGSVWPHLFERLSEAHRAEAAHLDWVVSDPGKMQTQLVAGSLDVGFFGPIGLAALRARGNDILLFGPGTTNHSVWLVKERSLFRKPSDLKGGRIATQPETAETFQQARIAASLVGLDFKKDFEVILGSPLANVALFERGDVDAIIALEPTASRLVAQGAREIGRVGTMWREATGATEDPFLVGLAAQRSWLEKNRPAATRLAQLFATGNRRIAADPSVLKDVHGPMGLRDSEAAAIALLPQRMKYAYSPSWNARAWRGIDQQIDSAVKAGILPQRPQRPVYDELALEP